ncbi:hypothetical protein Pfo_000154 [Paulownia fortunei]|nr:hypothetical protein Pfo_000154 [Paulownia fortunei]
MPLRKELCGNSQRGVVNMEIAVNFFIHTTTIKNQSFWIWPGTPFQHTNQQQQMTNLFGFGVQNNAQLRGANDFWIRTNQFKVIISFNSKATLLLTHCQHLAVNPSCTDSEPRKQIIVEDLENEKPLWKLTCYGHNRKLTERGVC